MSERDFFPDNSNSSGNVSSGNLPNGNLPDDSLPPQPIPRAGMGIASRIGFPDLSPDAPQHDQTSTHQSTPVALEDSQNDESQNGEMLPIEDTDDPALIPELAPLAAPTSTSVSSPTNSSPMNSSPMITSRSVDDIALDEFDVQSRNGMQQYSGRGGDGNGPTVLAEQEDDDEFGEAGQNLFSHLAELRARILYSVIAVALASAVTWNYGKWIQEFLARPILTTMKASGMSGAQLITIDPTEGFYLYFQITLASAILLSAPFILFQMWRFIEPALTRTERRYTIFLVPFSVLLFFSGVTLGYLLSPLFFSFFLQFQPAETVANFSYGKSVALLAKMLLVFGVCFQVPVVTIFLNKIGLISRNFLIEYWRHAVIVIFAIVAVITPTWDPLTLCACATPPCLLYVLSIWLVKWL